MKNAIILLLFALFCFAGCKPSSSSSSPAASASASKVEVPELILTRFNALYSNISDVEWEKEKDRYEVTFTQNKNVFTVVFLADGMVEQTEIKVDVASLPSGISEYVTTNLGGKKIDEASKITDGFGTVTYEIEVDKVDYLFSTTGSFVGQQETDEEEDDQDKE